MNPEHVIPGIAWPPLPANNRGIFEALSDAEGLTHSQIQTGQLSQLRALAGHAREQTEWGRRNLPEHFSWETFHALPVLKRAFVQSHESALRADSIPPEHGAVGALQTSGSTGTPVRVWKSTLASAVWQAVTARDHQWHQRDLTLTLAAIRQRSDAPYPGLHGPSWGAAAAMLGGNGGTRVLDIFESPQRQLEWLDQHDFGYLLTFPSNLSELLRLCEERDHRWPGLREVRTVSEPVTDELRARCREILGVEIVDQYSTQEVGYIALQRPDGPGYYAMSDTHVVEVLNDDGRPCEPGEVGRVVVTALHNFAMPLFRYDVGDLALVGEPGPLPYLVIERVFGRTRNLMLAPDGTRRWPNMGAQGLARIAPIIQHQYVQSSPRHIVVRLVTRRPVTDVEEEAMRTHLARHLPAGIGFSFSYEENIPRGAGGKFEDFICEVS